MVLSESQRAAIVRILQLAAFVGAPALFVWVQNDTLRTIGMFAILAGFYLPFYVLMATRAFNGAPKPKGRRRPADG